MGMPPTLGFESPTIVLNAVRPALLRAKDLAKRVGARAVRARDGQTEDRAQASDRALTPNVPPADQPVALRRLGDAHPAPVGPEGRVLPSDSSEHGEEVRTPTPRGVLASYSALRGMGTIELRNKVIAISGASSGIGAATAIACARAGMCVALCARREDRLAALVDDIRHAGGRAMSFVADVSDPAQCQAFVDKTVETFGSLYAVYANAGYGLEKPILDTTDREMRAIFETNFFGTLNLVRPAAALMLKNQASSDSEPRGHVLICSSCLARQTLPFYGAYCATKAAQHHIGRALRLELATQSIAVTTVHPITTRTELFDLVKRKSGIQQLSHESPGWFTQSAESVGDRTVACLRKPKTELWPGVRGQLVRLGMTLGSLMPGLTDRALRGMVTKRELAAGDKPASKAEKAAL
ncbi:MAG: SDR family NAD(P)-dependent oxidoreductase [Phycisphaerales bacterium]|nr:SDR family NAD(P)-dependent oxidoreductase [Phycisphaerales bacterium]